MLIALAGFPAGASTECRSLVYRLQGDCSTVKLYWQNGGREIVFVSVPPCVGGKKRCNRNWSDRRVSNSQPSAWKADALPVELLPHGRALLVFIRNVFPQNALMNSEHVFQHIPHPYPCAEYAAFNVAVSSLGDVELLGHFLLGETGLLSGLIQVPSHIVTSLN